MCCLYCLLVALQSQYYYHHNHHDYSTIINKLSDLVYSFFVFTALNLGAWIAIAGGGAVFLGCVVAGAVVFLRNPGGKLTDDFYGGKGPAAFEGYTWG